MQRANRKHKLPIYTDEVGNPINFILDCKSLVFAEDQEYDEYEDGAYLLSEQFDEEDCQGGMQSFEPEKQDV